MSNNILFSVYDLSVKLANCIGAEEYDKATQTADLLDKEIRKLDRAAMLDLSGDQITFLHSLARWLTDQDGTLRERSKNLIDIIAPLNEHTLLNQRKKY
ncbi:hypothetical protein R6Y90_01365 [Alteromonas macleodii]|uniref:hypothetical protein n=1 Tax=Alteromonas macleodii TaxID=28108 RepID=UPI0029811A85|nr:hypothetical protein [Alteromonas macleodii]MDW5283613.1 hypothetical protein [Alteromonas macleodii]